MERLERFYKIDHLLKDRKVVSFSALQSSLGISRATLKRERDRFNAPIEYDREANGYRFGKPRTGPRYEVPGLWFNAAEIHALLTTLQLLDGKFVVLRMPYPSGLFAKNVDGRIDDPGAGWKGRGLWTTTGTRTPFHLEGGKQKPEVIKKSGSDPEPAGAKLDQDRMA
jgi:hypothetical protein